MQHNRRPVYWLSRRKCYVSAPASVPGKPRFHSRYAELIKAGVPVILAGDYNVVPAAQDIYPTRSLDNNALIQPQSRQAYARLLSHGWTDALRPRWTKWGFRKPRSRTASQFDDVHPLTFYTMVILKNTFVSDCAARKGREVVLHTQEIAPKRHPAWVAFMS